MSSVNFGWPRLSNKPMSFSLVLWMERRMAEKDSLGISFLLMYSAGLFHWYLTKASFLAFWPGWGGSVLSFLLYQLHVSNCNLALSCCDSSWQANKKRDPLRICSRALSLSLFIHRSRCLFPISIFVVQLSCLSWPPYWYRPSRSQFVGKRRLQHPQTLFLITALRLQGCPQALLC